MIELVMAAALLQAPDPCNAAGRAEQARPGCPVWRLIRRNEEGTGHIDPASLRRDGNLREVTTRTLMNRPINGLVHSFNIRVQLDCAARTTRNLGIIGFGDDGRTVFEHAEAGDAERVTPGSAFAELIDEFCPAQVN